MLTEIAVVLSLAFVGIVSSLLLARQVLARAAAGAEARRLVNAASRAAEMFLFREGKLAAASVLGALLLVVGSNGLFVLRRAHGFTMAAALWTALGTLAGAALTLGVAYVAMAVGLRATQGALRASQASLDGAVTLSVRASGVTALAADALGTSAVTGLFALVYLLGGGGASLGPVEAATLLDRAAAALPGLALGSVVIAGVLGVSGAVYHVSAGIGGLGAESLDALDARNPSLVAVLVSEHVGLGVRRAVDMVAGTTLAQVAMLSIGVASFRTHAAALGGHAWALVTLPLVVRGVGVVASAFGLMTSRATEAGLPAHALWRGQATAGVLVSGGLAGACLWLLGSPAFGWVVGAGVLGVGAAFVVGHAARLRIDRKLSSMQDALEATRVGHAVTAARGVAIGFRSLLLPVAALTVSLAGAFQLGQLSRLPGGPELAMETALAGLLATSAFMLAVGLFGPVTSGALSIAALDPEGQRPEVRRRTALLADAGFEGGAVAESFFIVVGCVGALVAGLSIPHGAPPLPEPLPFARPEAFGAGALGAALVLFLGGSAVGVAARAARATLLEVERQLRGFPREGGVPVLPIGFTPSYRTLVEVAGKLSVEGVLVLVAAGLVAPAAVGLGLRALHGAGSGLAAEGLTAFVVLSAGAGLAAALSADGARGVLAATYRASRPRGTASGFEAALAGHELGTFLGGAFAPTLHLFVKATAVAALLAAPFLSSV